MVTLRRLSLDIIFLFGNTKLLTMRDISIKETYTFTKETNKYAMDTYQEIIGSNININTSFSTLTVIDTCKNVGDYNVNVQKFYFLRKL